EGCRFFIENLLSQEYRIKEYSPAGDNKFNNAINFIFDSLRDKPPGYKFSVIGAMYSLFGVVLDEGIYSARAGHSPADEKSVVKLKNVLTYMRENYDKQLSLEDMAKSAGMSPKYFCLFFRNMTGKTPLEYLNGYRVEKASKELIKTYKTVTEIAYACGFNDLSYFIKTFKKHKGVTPAKFRKR
ncbi:MAG: helix-turn-helix transcriptional regulator, partial [Clostridia bacterium]|nr:helix-turn-helix transcriptional regulator [Clostridia bacterium]